MKKQGKIEISQEIREKIFVEQATDILLIHLGLKPLPMAHPAMSEDILDIVNYNSTQEK